MRRERFIGVAAVLAVLVVFARTASAEDDAWAALRPLLGTWQGTGAGFGATASVSHEWEFVLGGRFLRLQTRSVSAHKDGREEVHEDVGYVSLDTDRGTFVFRQFLSEGFVNTYDLVVREGENREIDFSYREVESAGGLRAQMRLAFAGSDNYSMILDLASAGEDFAACQEMQLQRVGNQGGTEPE